ncbi:MAG: hypothetical protein ACPGVK_05180 [Halocynthiibacter sp.]
MKHAFMITTAAALGLSACSTINESRFNPRNWGGPKVEMLDVAPEIESSDTRPLAPHIDSLRIESTPSGVIVHATTTPATQGYFDAELVALNDGEAVDGRVDYEFRIIPPRTRHAVSTQQSREVSVGTFISNFKLAEARSIRVISKGNTKTARLRRR